VVASQFWPQAFPSVFSHHLSTSDTHTHKEINIMNPDSASYQELQSECKRLGLSAVGTMSDLKRRLKGRINRQNNFPTDGKETTPQPATSPPAPVKQSRRRDTKSEVSSQLAYHLGRPSTDIPGLLEATNKMMTLLLEDSEAQDKLLAEQHLLLKSLHESFGSMTASLSPYHQQRDRFISTFKKDKLGTATRMDLAIIGKGNFIPEAGDAATDALLYSQPTGRRDIKTFQKLYGLHPATVRKLRE